MRSVLTIEVAFDDAEGRWQLGVMSKWADRLEMVRSEELGPFTTKADVRNWLTGLYDAWCVPTLGGDAGESLHDVWADLKAFI